MPASPTSAASYPSNLPNKPLVEAIFELRWALQPAKGATSVPQPQVDPGFPFLLGRYFERISKAYPHVRELPAASLPEELAAYVVRQQFRAKPDGWPVTQLGPGILTVNETQGYAWKSFEPMILEASNAVFETYPQSPDLPPLKPVSVTLRYQNAMPYELGRIPPREFLRSKLHTALDLDVNLFRGPGGVQEPTAVTISSVFPLNDLPGEGSLLIASGLKNESPAIILDVSVRTKGNPTPTDSTGLKTWLSTAHTIAESWFFTLCRGELREFFESKS